MNLMKLNSALYIGKDGLLPQVTVEELERHAGGLICLTGGEIGGFESASVILVFRLSVRAGRCLVGTCERCDGPLVLTIQFRAEGRDEGSFFHEGFLERNSGVTPLSTYVLVAASLWDEIV